MNVTIKPSTVSGVIQAPASKSSMQRACAAALLSGKKVIMKNPGHSNDDKAALNIIQRLGADINVIDHETIEIESNFLKSTPHFVSKEKEINCGESGLSIRMFTPIAALCENEISVTGEGSLSTRPMYFFDEVLPLIGVSINSNNGKLPLILQGPLKANNILIDGSLSSQFLTGLLMAFSAVATEGTTICVNDLKSKPYIDLTLDVMKKFGLNVPENKDYKEFVFHNAAPDSIMDETSYTVEGDWSGGAFLLVAGAIAGNITVRDLSLASKQADKKIIDALMAANAGIAMETKGIKMITAPMKAFKFDATDCPDLFPPLVALAAYCDGITKIKGVSRLTHKESNRGITLQEEFGKMGLKVEIDNDEMKIHGGGGLKGAIVSSRHDHRIAMACAVAGLKADGETMIESAEAINKSYPDFYDHLRFLGASISGDKFDWKQLARTEF